MHDMNNTKMSKRGTSSTMPDLGAEDGVDPDTDILLELVKSNGMNERLTLAICKQVLLQPVGGK
jgi:hypothetical protein